MTRRKDPRSARLPVRDVVAQGGQLPAFTPVPRKCNRHDGWTPARQRSFIEALADTGSVEAACRAVDMTTVGAYHLRRQAGAEEFRAAWEAALQLGVQRVEDIVMDRALNGVEEPLYSYGKLIGTRTRYNDRLLMFILRNRAPERFAEGAPKGLNAVGRMEAERLKKQWRADWEAEQAASNVSAAEVRASIDRKVEEVRTRLRHERERRWVRLSEETRAAWAHFVTLRDRDLTAIGADEGTRRVMETGWQAAADALEPPEKPALPAPEREAEDEGVPKAPDWHRKAGPPAPHEPRTTWTLRDGSFDP